MKLNKQIQEANIKKIVKINIDQRKNLIDITIVNLLDDFKKEIKKTEDELKITSDEETKFYLEDRLKLLTEYNYETNYFICVLLWHSIENIMYKLTELYFKKLKNKLKRLINDKNTYVYINIDYKHLKLDDVKRFFKYFSNIELNKLQEFETCNFIRLICNCYKHNNSYVSEELSKAYSGLPRSSFIKKKLKIKKDTKIKIENDILDFFKNSTFDYCEKMNNCSFNVF